MSRALVRYFVPSADIPEFYGCTKRNQESIRRWLDAMAIIEDSPGVIIGLHAASKAFQGIRGFSFTRIRTRYYDWKESGKNWRTFIDRTVEKTTNNTKALPHDFLEEVRRRIEKNQRSARQAIESIRHDWRRGLPVQGYGTWRDWFGRAYPRTAIPQCFPGSYPKGWTYRNLVRKKSTRFQLKAVRVGRGAAASERRLVYTTRANLYVGSHYMFDDMWHDLMVMSSLEGKPGRPLELFSHDLYSARKVRWGFRVRTRNDDGTFNQLAESMTRLILCATLFFDGYSPRGTIIVAEHGTAAVRDRVEKILHDSTDGLITVARSGMVGAEAHAGLYPALQKGNFRFKASLESSNNLTHNVFAQLDGQTGKDILNRPEELHGRLANATALRRAASMLSPERAALLQIPLLTSNEFGLVAQDLYNRIEDDTEHNLEGWAMNEDVEICILGQWIGRSAILALPDAEQQATMDIIQSGAIATRQRKLSRRAVWNTGATHLKPIPAQAVCDILGPDLARERKISKQMFEFGDKEISADPLRYSALVRDQHGRETLLQDGETYSTMVNPFAPEVLFILDSKHRYIGTAPRVQSVCKSDLDAIHRACGEAAHIESLALAPVRARHMQDARDRAARARHNARVIAGEPVTPGEIEDDRALRDLARNATDADREAITDFERDDAPGTFSSEEISTLFAET
jgi:hypothetical protein